VSYPGHSLSIMTEPEKVYKQGFYRATNPYPAWRYHKIHDPRIVRNTEEDVKAAEEGWEVPEGQPRSLRPPPILNWRYDLEEMSARQLRLFALEEFDVDLPVEASKERLFKALWRLYKHSPKTRDRMVLMAQVIEMNYDEAQSEIREAIKKAEHIHTKEFYA
jgi:hypothetical protein